MLEKHQQNLPWAHPLVAEWFTNKFGMPTEPQIHGWPSILARKITLISAPTGSGKTFAAFLTCIDDLVRLSLAQKLEDQVKVVYVSPLKALSNDIQKNLMVPLQEITELAKQYGYKMQDIRVSVRTGDTPSRDRQLMLKKPPHILVTTPESLYILLTAEKSREMLRQVKTVIVDEIHALADDKRGSHLTLTLERLSALTAKKPVRIGLSATQKPLSLVGHFLAGSHHKKLNIIDIGHTRQLELSVVVPASELGAVASNEMWDEIYDEIAQLTQTNRSTLIFVNTRRLAERVAHHLSERLGEEQVAAHHGSLSKKLRLQAETKLKNGELKALVATASLELGIDIGNIDLVCQIGSPRAIAVALQRVGRAGHWHGAISKGKIFATTRDELVECAALVYAVKIGDLDKLIIPYQPLDILAQQIVAMCSAEKWQEDDLFQLVRQAYPYRNLSRETFNTIITMLSEGIAGSRGRYGTYLFRDQVNHVVQGRRGSRLTAITSGGAIPDIGLFTVVAEPDNTVVGTLDEDFAVESNRGDIILLGSSSWMIKRVEARSGKVIVQDAHGAPPSVPFWRGEAPARTDELSLHVAQLREKISELLPNDSDSVTSPNKSIEVTNALTWVKENCGLDNAGAEQLLEYIRQGRALLGAVPSQKIVVAERFFDEGGGMQLIIHAPFGARINKAWGLALRKKFCRSFNFELQAAATDNGINIALAEQHSFPLQDVFHFLHPNSIKQVLTQAVLQSPLFASRWRFAATRSLALVRFRHGKKVPPNIMRMLSDDLLAAVFPDAAACQDNLAGRDIDLPDHPLINEAIKDALTEAMDLEGLTKILKDMIAGKINCLAVDTPTPSQFSHEILNANPYAYLDDAPLEERRARAVEMRRMLPEHLLNEVGKLDPNVILEVQQSIWPDIRNIDELHDLLQTLIAVPEKINLDQDRQNNWTPLMAELIETGRVNQANINNKIVWLATEKAKTFLAIYPTAKLVYPILDIEKTEPERMNALETMLRGWLQQLGPTCVQQLATLLELPQQDVEQTLLKLESTGLILRGQYTNADTLQTEWCERRLLARIHRLTLRRLRKEIEPISPAQFIQWLLQWQHVTPGTQLKGEQGVLEVLKQLQGFEMPANAWEQRILSKRIQNYSPQILDYLCLTGAVGWGRLSPHPASLSEANERGKRIMPRSVAPITFFVREDAAWMANHDNPFTKDESLVRLSHVAKSIYEYLKIRGASFFPDIVRGVNHLKSEVEQGLWELVAAGMITADGFDNLRALINPKRRLNKHRRQSSLRFSNGRWTLLHSTDNIPHDEKLTAICWLLLKRYGVVFRDLLTREKNIPRWRELLITFRRLEERGEIRGGRFVSGFLGEQFALPYAVESLRAMRKQVLQNESITISAADPLNLVGIILPGEKINSHSRKKIILRDGVAIQVE